MNARVWNCTTLAILLSAIPSQGQTPVAGVPPSAANDASSAPVQQSGNYVVGPHDVLIITSYDQPELTGKFTIETDGTFTYPYIGRVNAGGTTLRGVETALKNELIRQGFFRDPQITVAIEQYRSQKVYLVGEVRSPGAYSMSGNMRLVEALALAGSTLPSASGEAVIVHASSESLVVDGQSPETGDLRNADPSRVIRVDLRELENGNVSQNVALMNGDTVFVLRAESVYVFGQVRSPGAYPLRQRNTTVLQALSLAGGTTDRGATGRIQIIRIVDGKKVEVRAGLTDFVEPRDTIIVPERFF
jgi:polysaccharide export outer membrane protein